MVDKMSSPRTVLKQDTRMLGAAQVIVGLIHSALGYIWIQLYDMQIQVLLLTYRPIALLSGYPFWAFFFYVMSGVSAIEAEKKCSPALLKCTIRMNINSVGVAMIGQLITIIEIALFSLKAVKIQWPQCPAYALLVCQFNRYVEAVFLQKSGIILSVYLWIFTIVELYLANTVVKWGIQAFHRGNYSL